MIAVRENTFSGRPCLVLAHGDPAFAAPAERSFRRQGWDVYPAASGPQARRLARMLEADLVVLDAELPGESGWLTCDKLTREFPLLKVLLVINQPDPAAEALARFVGASALTNRADGMTKLIPAAYPYLVHAAG